MLKLKETKINLAALQAKKEINSIKQTNKNKGFYKFII